MNILPSTVLPAGVAAAAQIGATTPLSGTLAASALSLPEPGSTTVELSRLGMFLSSLALARKKIADLGQPAGNAANPPTDDFAAVAGAAQDLVDAFNNLRTDGIDTIQTPADALLEQQLRQNLTPAGQQETSTDPAALAGIGLTLQAATPDGAPDTLALDLPALQAAFTANPAATLAQLRQTAIEFGTLGAAFAQQDIELTPAPDSAPAGAAPASIAAAPDGPVIDGTQVDSAAAPVDVPNSASNSAPAEVADSNQAALPQNSVADMALGDLLTEIKNNVTLQDNGAAEVAASVAAPAAPPAAPAIEPLQDAGHANVLAHDSAVAAAIAAYNLNQGPFRTGSNGNPELASNAKREVIAPVQAVTRVAAVNPIDKPGAGS